MQILFSFIFFSVSTTEIYLELIIYAIHLYRIGLYKEILCYAFSCTIFTRVIFLLFPFIIFYLSYAMTSCAICFLFVFYSRCVFSSCFVIYVDKFIIDGIYSHVQLNYFLKSIIIISIIKHTNNNSSDILANKKFHLLCHKTFFRCIHFIFLLTKFKFIPLIPPKNVYSLSQQATQKTTSL